MQYNISVNVVTIMLAGAFVVFEATLISGKCSSQADIAKVFVIHRRLKFAPIKVCELAHSALILRTTNGKECVLEYLKDGKAHLYDANPTIRWGCKRFLWGKTLSKCYYFMKDDTGARYVWSREKSGNDFPAASGQVSPQKAQEQMQKIMGHDYDFLRNNCHMAQEKLREAWGLKVDEPYLDPTAICDCGKQFYKSNSFFSDSVNWRLFDKIHSVCEKLAHRL